jgi:hypothetical protein
MLNVRVFGDWPVKGIADDSRLPGQDGLGSTGGFTERKALIKEAGGENGDIGRACKIGLSNATHRGCCAFGQQGSDPAQGRAPYAVTAE